MVVNNHEFQSGILNHKLHYRKRFQGERNVPGTGLEPARSQ